MSEPDEEIVLVIKSDLWPAVEGGVVWTVDVLNPGLERSGEGVSPSIDAAYKAILRQVEEWFPEASGVPEYRVTRL